MSPIARTTTRPKHSRLATLMSGLAVLTLGATLTTAGAAATTLATAAPAEAACSTSNFRDVPRSHGFYTAITWLNCQGIAKGYANGSFGVNQGITRGEVAVMLYRQTTPKHPKNGAQYFKDVPRKSYYTDAVNWMAQSGLSKGYTGRYFRPRQAITRGEVSALIYRLAGSKYAGPTKSPFRDMTKGRTGFYNEATWMLNQGLISGYSDWTFRPTKKISRGETAKMLKNSNRFVATRGDVKTPVMKPLPGEVSKPAPAAPTWKVKAANWATAKAKSPKTFYRWGGNGPNAFDCSGFTTGAFSAGGEKLPRQAKAQYTAADKYVPKSQAKTGDLVYWSNNGKASGVYHVAIVVNGGKIAHARNPSSGVTLTALNYSPANMLPKAGRFN